MTVDPEAREALIATLAREGCADLRHREGEPCRGCVQSARKVVAVVIAAGWAPAALRQSESGEPGT